MPPLQPLTPTSLSFDLADGVKRPDANLGQQKDPGISKESSGAAPRIHQGVKTLTPLLEYPSQPHLLLTFAVPTAETTDPEPVLPGLT